MKRKEFFYKKFSVGLTLDASFSEFESFLSEYADYISNFYFSLPLGDKFHARVNVVKQMHDPSKVELLWKMLKTIKSYGIDLELVLNNGNVTENDIVAAKKMLAEHGAAIDLIGLTDDIYANVKKHFPDLKTVYSFKNRSHVKKDYENASGHYDEIVLGRQNVRNVELFSFVKNRLNSKVVLLLNNGCSHICGGCSTTENCHSSYYRAKLNRSSEYLYALQSIMPYEIHDGLLDLTNVDLFKIASRNASLQYLSDCLNSYVNRVEDEYIEKSYNNYMLWGRLAWHVEYYDEFSLQRIRNYKASIYCGKEIPVLNKKIALCRDLRDKPFFEDRFECDEERVLSAINKELRGLPYTIDECITGVSNCRNLFGRITKERFEATIKSLVSEFNKIDFEIPPLISEDYALLNVLLKSESAASIDCYIVNDLNTARYIVDNFSFPIAFGEGLSFSNIYSPPNDYRCDNDANFGSDLIGSDLRKTISETGDVKFVVCDMTPKGLCIAKNEKMPIYVNVRSRGIAFGTCNAKENSECDGQCLKTVGEPCSHILNDRPWRLHCNGIREYIEDYAPLVKTIYENRAKFIIEV